MNGNDLRKLSRKDLLEILLEQAKRIEELEHALEKEQDNKKINMSMIAEVGSLAEASLVLTEIFKKADEAVELYKSSVEDAMKKEERLHKKRLKDMKTDALKTIAIKEQKLEEKRQSIEDKINYYKNKSESKKNKSFSNKNLKRKFR